MADETTPTTTVQAPPASGAPSSTPDYTAELAELQELRRFRDEYTPVLEKIAPLWDDVRPIIEDEDQREYWKTARDARQRQLDSQKPQLTPELKMIRDEFESTLTPIVEYVRGDQQAKAAQAQERQQAAFKVNYDYAERLCAERPELKERNYAGINMLAQIAYRDGTSLEEAWKSNSGMFAGSQPKREPPTSLRGGAAAPGVPGESTATPIKTRKDLHSRLVTNLRAGGLKG